MKSTNLFVKKIVGMSELRNLVDQIIVRMDPNFLRKMVEKHREIVDIDISVPLVIYPVSENCSKNSVCFDSSSFLFLNFLLYNCFLHILQPSPYPVRREVNWWNLLIYLTMETVMKMMVLFFLRKLLMKRNVS